MAQKKNETNSIFDDAAPVFGGFGAGFAAMFEAQRKNMQALAEANQKAVEGWQALARRQSEMVTEFVQDNADLTRRSIEAQSPEDKMAQQAEAARAVYERSIANTRELAEILTNCTREAAEIVTQQITASVADAQKQAQK